MAAIALDGVEACSAPPDETRALSLPSESEIAALATALSSPEAGS